KDAIGEKGWKAKADISTSDAWMITRDSMTWQRANEPFVCGPWDILLLPGGVKSIEKVRLDRNVIDTIQSHFYGGKIVGSICHGAQLLIEANLAFGHRISGYKSIATDIKNAGGTYVDGVVT